MPLRILLPGPVTDASLGVFHSFAIVEDKLFAWGSNLQGQLGPTKVKVKEHVSKPVEVSLPEGADKLVKVHCGNLFTIV